MCDETFFEQLTSEQVVTRKREGRPYRVWVLPSGKRNEILDCVVLALAAYKSAPAGLEGQLAPAALATVAPPPPMPEMAGVTITTVGAKPRFSQDPRDGAPDESAALKSKRPTVFSILPKNCAVWLRPRRAVAAISKLRTRASN